MPLIIQWAFLQTGAAERPLKGNRCFIGSFDVQLEVRRNAP
jgi:hypothetical protein